MGNQPQARRTGKQQSVARKFRRLTQTDIKGYHPPRSKTGQPEWFKRMKLQAEFKRVLSKIRVAAVQELPENIRVSLVAGGYDDVWKLSQADAKDLLKCKGIGPVTLRTIRALLVERAVPVTWSAE